MLHGSMHWRDLNSMLRSSMQWRNFNSKLRSSNAVTSAVRYAVVWSGVAAKGALTGGGEATAKARRSSR